MRARTIRRFIAATTASGAFLWTHGSPIGSASPDRAAAPPPASSGPPSVVLIVTDDHRADTLRFMPNVRRLLVGQGIRFDAGYVVNPVCCPSRATALTGQYSHSTGVYTNRASRSHGGFPAFRDDSTVATWLQAAGYRTALIGKYLNGYGRGTSAYVPPGWDRWFVTFGDGGYFDYSASVDGRVVRFGSDASDYGTTVLRREAVSFIRASDASQPLFLLWAPHAPHAPAIPARRDRSAYPSLEPWRPTSYDEEDVTDKPAHVATRPTLDADERASLDAFRLGQIRSLHSVDRSVAAIMEALDATGRLGNTMIVFTSDNGMLWGEHRLQGKSEVYEEAISVPFVVRFDPLIDEPRTDDHLVLNLDLAPTFADLAGVAAPGAEGRSLLPLLASSDGRWRTSFLIEHLGLDGGRRAPTFCAIHTRRSVFVRYATGEEELYDLARDPHQMTNRAGWTRYASLRRKLLAELRTLCDPQPPGADLFARG